MSTTEAPSRADRGSGSSDLLGPLPKPAYPALREGDLQTAPWEVDCWTADQVREYGQQERAAERERTVLAVTAMRIAAECIAAAYKDDWAAFDRLSDDFDDAVAAVGELCEVERLRAALLAAEDDASLWEERARHLGWKDELAPNAEVTGLGRNTSNDD